MAFASRLPRALPIVLIQLGGILGLAQAPESATAPAAPLPRLDGGLLDPAWFSPDPLEFRTAGKLDYLWVRPRFALEGRTVQFMPWPTPQLPATRDGNDRKAARKVVASFPARLAADFAKKLAGKVEVVATAGELRAFGRVVDCNAGNPAGFVWAHCTFELKIVDGADVLQVAVHTRLLGKANSTNFRAWAKTVVKPFVADIEGAWREGESPEG